MTAYLSALFFFCPTCGERPLLPQDKPFFPICSSCYQDLVEAPALCSRCGSPACPSSAPSSAGDTCSRPWIIRPEIDSYSARYLLVGRSYAVLKRWKVRGGFLLNRRILKPSTSLLSTWEKFSPDAIVPIPQSYDRSWAMGGSRAELIARWVSAQLGKPTCEVLRMRRNNRSLSSRQAELGLLGRYEKRFSHEVQSDALNRYQRIIVVDDFMTTGRTLSQAAKDLRASREDLKIHVFCLGIRPPAFTAPLPFPPQLI